MQCCSSGILPKVKYTNGIDSDPVQSIRRAKYTFLLIHTILFSLVSVFLVTVFHEDFPLKLCKHLYLIISELHTHLIVGLIRIVTTYTETETEFFAQYRACQLCRIKAARIAKRWQHNTTLLWLTSSRWKQQVPLKRRQLFAD